MKKGGALCNPFERDANPSKRFACHTHWFFIRNTYVRMIPAQDAMGPNYTPV
jgi:hypothetical protein